VWLVDTVVKWAVDPGGEQSAGRLSF
jgi:hypothetical protein